MTQIQNLPNEMENPSKMTAQELLLQTYTPHVAVLASPAAQTLCSKNNLNFTQLIKPFGSVTVPASWQEPTGGQITLKRLRLTFVDIGSWKPPQLDTQKNRKVLYGKVAQIPPPPYENDGNSGDTQQFQTCKLGKPGYTEEYLVKVPSITPWFESWRQTFLHMNSEQESSQHEFLSHLVACLLVISSSEAKTSEDCVNIIGKLSKLQLQHQTEWPNTWVLPNTLKYYLILHDNSSADSNSAEDLYQKMRITYGGNFCFMLKINSSPTSNNNPDLLNPNPWSFILQEKLLTNSLNSGSAVDAFDNINTNDLGDVNSCAADFFHPLSPENELPHNSFDPSTVGNGSILPASSLFSNPVTEPKTLGCVNVGQFITIEDVRSIQSTVNEFLSKAMLPYIERQVKLLYETILNRRSMSKSFFGATKRLFGSGKALSSIVYAADSPEVICRKLADLYFLFGHYAGAYQMYHQLKKDFQIDQAWVYYAAALEMAAISHFMMTQSDSPVQGARSFPVHYVNEAIRVYMENCRMTDAALRCALLCCECLNQIENFGEAAAVYIRMTSEECDLRSALMLEQASYAFLSLNSPRKYALHCVLAGNRYSKAALRTHSLNCYHQAHQIYYGKGWRFAEDHVHFTMIKHKSFLKINQGLATYFKALLKTPTPQAVTQVKTQEVYYKEFLFSMARLHQEDQIVEDFHVPKIIANELRLRIGNPGLAVGEIEHIPSSFEDKMESYWDSLEEQVVKECIDESVVRFKPSRLLFENGTDNTVHPAVPINECLYVEVPIENSLPIQVVLSNLRLHFEPSITVKSTSIKDIVLEPMETKIIRFAVSSSKRGRITFESLTYNLEWESLSVPFKQKFKLKGPRLNKTKAEKSGKVYAKDMRNEINVIEQMPLVQAQVTELPCTLYQSQSINFSISLQDKCNECEERKRITRVILACEHMTEYLEINRSGDLEVEQVQKNFSSIKADFSDQDSMRIPVTFKAPQHGETAVLRILVVYQVTKRADELHSSSGHTLSTTPPASASKLAWEPIHRVIKLVVRLPLLPCLRLEYTFLKPLDALSRLGLLRIHNMTQTSHLELSEVGFNMPSIIVEKIVSSETISESDKFRFVVGPNESRNIVIQTKEVKSNDEAVEDTVRHRLFLFAHWKFTHVDPSLLVSPAGMYRLRLKWKDDLHQPDASPTSFIIQVYHPSRVSHDFIHFPCYVSPVTLQISSKYKGRISVRILRNEPDRTENQSGGRLNNRASEQDVYFVGQTKWILDVELNESYRIKCNAAVSHPGVFNVGPLLRITKYIQDPNNVSGVLIEDELMESNIESYNLHSPLIIAHREGAGRDV